jgi:hypothetical protein
MGSGSFGRHFFGGCIDRMYGHPQDWMARTRKITEDELRYSGLAPEVISEVVNKVEGPSYGSPCCWPL